MTNIGAGGRGKQLLIYLLFTYTHAAGNMYQIYDVQAFNAGLTRTTSRSR